MANVYQSQYSKIAIRALNADTASYFSGSVAAALEILDEGSTLTTSVTSIDFVGAGVTATNAGSAVTVTIPGGGSTDTGSLLKTASAAGNTITFTKGDGSTFPVTVAGGTGTPGGSNTQLQFNSASVFSGSGNLRFDYVTNTIHLTGSISASSGANTVGFFGTASWAQSSSRAVSSSYSLSSSYALSGSYTLSASYALSSSYALSASFASTASFITASNVWGPFGSSSILSASYAQTASYSQQSSDIILQVINQTGAQINKGIVVRITSSNNSSDIPRISVADWTNDNLSANTVGLVMANIANGGTGSVMTEGLFKGYDTDTPGWTTGQLLFLGANGSITGSAPQAPLHGVRLGQVTRVQPINGSIYVRIDNGYELDELHDVLITNPTNGDILVRSSSVWINSNQLTGSYGLTGSLTATSFTGSLFGTASWANSASNAINAQTASFLPVGTYNITASWAQSASNAINAQTASFLPVATYNITASWANSASQALTASFVQTAQTASYITGSVFTSANPVLSASYALTASHALNGGGSGTTINNNVNDYIITATGTANTLNGEANLQFNGSTLIVTGNITASSDITANGDLKSNASAGDEGGQIFLNKPVTNTSITGGINIDVYQNRVRIFENGGTNRGGYWDITSLNAGAGTNLLGGSFTSTSSLVGNGSATSFNINHGFNTRNLHITVYESGSNGETVYPDIRRINANTASIIFANPPTLNQYIVYISQ